VIFFARYEASQFGSTTIETEHLRNVKPLSGGRAEFVFCALNIAKADGAPARVLARPVAG